MLSLKNKINVTNNILEFFILITIFIEYILFTTNVKEAIYPIQIIIFLIFIGVLSFLNILDIFKYKDTDSILKELMTRNIYYSDILFNFVQIIISILVIIISSIYAFLIKDYVSLGIFVTYIITQLGVTDKFLNTYQKWYWAYKRELNFIEDNKYSDLLKYAQTEKNKEV